MADKNTNTLTKRILNNLQCVGSVKKAKVGHLLSNPCHGNLIQFFFFPQFEPDQNTTNFYRPFQEAAHVILCLFKRELKTYSRESDDIYWAKMLIKIMIFFLVNQNCNLNFFTELMDLGISGKFYQPGRN